MTLRILDWLRGLADSDTPEDVHTKRQYIERHIEAENAKRIVEHADWITSNPDEQPPGKRLNRPHK